MTASLTLPKPARMVPGSPPARSLPEAWPDEVPGVGLRRSAFLPAEPSSVHQTRVFTVATLADWRLPGLFDDVILCVSELAGNSCRHADGDGAVVQVSLHLIGSFLSVHVRDANPGLPEPRPQPGLDPGGMPDWNNVEILPESGYGLRLVEEFADGWCWWPSTVGKVVAFWFRTEKTEDA